MAGPHDKILASAAKAALGPLNFRRKGQSRLWLCDNGWWLGVVEFQPSSWSEGSYLNVAAHWLWSDSGHVSFDFGGRVSEHQQFQSAEQFAPAATDLAASAVIESKRLLHTFSSVEVTADVLLHDVRTEKDYRNGHPGWAAYNAGVACALVGRSDDAMDMFALVRTSTEPTGSHLQLVADRLAHLVTEPSAMKNEVTLLIESQRAALKLPKESVFSP